MQANLQFWRLGSQNLWPQIVLNLHQEWRNSNAVPQKDGGWAAANTPSHVRDNNSQMCGGGWEVPVVSQANAYSVQPSTTRPLDIPLRCVMFSPHSEGPVTLEVHWEAGKAHSAHTVETGLVNGTCMQRHLLLKDGVCEELVHALTKCEHRLKVQSGLWSG